MDFTKPAEAYRREVLRGQLDPIYDATEALAPQENSWDFLGSEHSRWKYLVSDTGKISIWLTFNHLPAAEEHPVFDPQAEGLPYSGKSGAQNLHQGYLPVSHMRFDLGGGEVWEQTAFLCADGGKDRILVCASGGGRRRYYAVHCPTDDDWRLLVNRPYVKPDESLTGAEFSRELDKLTSEYEALFSAGMRIHVPQERMVVASKAALIKAFNTYFGDKPRYGMTNYYCDEGRSAESFPPTTVTMVNVCLEWGFFERSRRYLDYYLGNYVSAEGRLIHRGVAGSSVSEHGMILDTAARYYNYTHDAVLLMEHMPRLTALANWLTGEIEKGRRNPPGSLTYGLIAGCPEDDVQDWRPEYWYSNNGWAYVGLTAICKTFIRMRQEGHAAPNAFGEPFLENMETFRADIAKSIAASVVQSADGPFVPPYPGFAEPFADMLGAVYYEGDAIKLLPLSCYANFRFYPEMLSSGVMTKDQSLWAIEYRERHNGDFLGTSKFKFTKDNPEGLDDYPLYNYLWALVNLGEVKRFLLACYGHMAHHQGRGTYFAPETTVVGRLSRSHCVPSQLTIPLAVKWMFVFTPRDETILWLNRATPKDWLMPGKEIRVENAPTRWGAVSYTVSAEADSLFCISVRIAGDRLPDKILIGLRNPGAGKMVVEETTRGAGTEAFQDHIQVRPGSNKTLGIKVRLIRN